MNELISCLLSYSYEHLSASKDDHYYLSAYLMDTLEVKDFTFKEIDTSTFLVPDEMVNALKERLAILGYDEKNTNKKITEIFGRLSPLPSKNRENFFNLYEESPKLATDYLFDLSIKNNYVQKTKIDQNVIIDDENKYGLIVTINLSKPEKSNKDIAKALASQNENVNYPLCPICIENEGCAGSSKTEPRQNLRLIPLNLANDTWYLQYSPYGYYNEHCIVILKDHIPMSVNKTNLTALFDFVDIFPHYFIGANSDLPIVGGSILSHEHFQGGSFTMPLMKAKTLYKLSHDKYLDTSFEILDYPTFVLKIKDDNKDRIINIVDEFYQTYLSYEDPSINLFKSTGDVRHNTMTTIVNKEDDKYSAYIIYRNNKTNEEYEGGIFHVRKEYQHIKNEGIGLIEAMGLFVLPARLKRQLKAVEEIVENPSIYDEMTQKYEDLKAFKETINDLTNKKFASVNEYLLHVGECILNDISIFKFDKDDKAKERFLSLLGLKK